MIASRLQIKASERPLNPPPIRCVCATSIPLRVSKTRASLARLDVQQQERLENTEEAEAHALSHLREPPPLSPPPLLPIPSPRL